MSKGTYVVAKAAIQHARQKNARKDKGSGKEERGREEDSSYYVNPTQEDVGAVLPRLVVGRDPERPVTRPMSDKKIKIVLRRLELSGEKK